MDTMLPMTKGSERNTQGIGGTVDAVLSKAFIDGRRSGLAGASPSLNPHQTGTPEAYQWVLGWRSGNASRAYADAMLCAECALPALRVAA